jgi:hypothetical protein
MPLRLEAIDQKLMSYIMFGGQYRHCIFSIFSNICSVREGINTVLTKENCMVSNKWKKNHQWISKWARPTPRDCSSIHLETLLKVKKISVEIVRTSSQPRTKYLPNTSQSDCFCSSLLGHNSLCHFMLYVAETEQTGAAETL